MCEVNSDHKRILNENKKEHQREIVALHKQNREDSKHKLVTEGNLKSNKFKINELQSSLTQLQLANNNSKMKLELSTRIDKKKDNTIGTMKQKLITLR